MKTIKSGVKASPPGRSFLPAFYAPPSLSCGPEPRPGERRRLAQIPRSVERLPSFFAQGLDLLPARDVGVGVRSVAMP